MKNKTIIYFLLMLVSCSSHRKSTTSNLTLTPLNYHSKLSDNYELSVHYIGLETTMYEFEITIKNKSKDSVFLNSSSFIYNTISEKNEKIPNYSINPDERIKKLKIKKDSLTNQKNPYSLAGKSVKEIATEGIIDGIIALFSGLNAEKMEQQRQESENNWNQNHDTQLNEVNRELTFWNNSILLPNIAPPNNKICGKVLFPISLAAKKIELIIPLQNEVFNFRFAQSN